MKGDAIALGILLVAIVWFVKYSDQIVAAIESALP